MILDHETARRYRAQGDLLAPSGVFEFHDVQSAPIWLEGGVPHVEFGELHADRPDSDAVYFDNPNGGRQATRHLIALGHRRIAFLGLHGTRDEPGFFLWSLQRETGWRRALQEAGVDCKSLSFRPSRPPAVGDDQAASARKTALRLLARDDIWAVVAVNGNAAHGLFEALREEKRPVEKWPAVVSFDTELMQDSNDTLHVVTALRLRGKRSAGKPRICCGNAGKVG